MATVSKHGEARGQEVGAEVVGPLLGLCAGALIAVVATELVSADWLQLAGRLLFVPIFVLSGIGHFAQRESMVAYAQQSGAPAPAILVPLTGLMILAGAVMIALGIWVDLGALLIVLFLLPTAFFMHAFWQVADPMMRAMQQAHFLKNISLSGAALLIAFVALAFGDQLGLAIGPVTALD